MDGTQEMLALGLCNIGGSLVRSMPVTGSFTRTAVNNSSGVKTTFGGLFTGKCVCVCVHMTSQTSVINVSPIICITKAEKKDEIQLCSIAGKRIGLG